MRTKLLVVGLLLCCLIVGLGASFQQQEKPKRYEYTIELNLSSSRANELGGVGWELVATAREGNDSNPVRYIFKRARP